MCILTTKQFNYKNRNVMKKLLILMSVMFVLVAMNKPLDKKITGTVTDATDGYPLSGVSVVVKGRGNGAVTDANGHYEIMVPVSGTKLVFSFIGYATKEIKVKSNQTIDVQMSPETQELNERVVIGYAPKRSAKSASNSLNDALQGQVAGVAMEYEYDYQYNEPVNEDYADINENGFQMAQSHPLSTFSIDVDAASYSNVRRFLNQGQSPPKDAVRIEEMINYFNYDYEQPKGKDPFSINSEIATAPWNEAHKLVHIGLQGKDIPTKDLPPSNLVFLIDVSGSMGASNKLPLLKSAFRLLVDKLRPEDNIAIVVYAGAAGEVLPSASGVDKDKIINALDRLNAGGSTAGGAGIQLAYKIARKNFKEGGNNRIILATDGDFNVGPSSNKAMEELIEERRDEGVFLTVLGFGMGNYKDSKMELLADKGNGNYAYIDNMLEAQKVFVNEFGGTLFTIAKDVKIQVEFNPAKVQAYRLVGYENRLLKAEDFNNDRKDAGELGSGHTVTALYEIIPVGVESQFLVDGLKYQKTQISEEAKRSDELMTVKLRYKLPDGDKSKLITQGLIDENKTFKDASDNFRWSAAVAAFGMQLRGSDYAGNITYPEILAIARGARGTDEEGYRAEFIRLVQSGQLLAKR